ncbi:MAG: HAMP domain-containing protein [Deltaproteobacteria bacterium]|nr:HAMP domain-containing protein [Deltaproteobacteria bacterium]
MTIKKKLILILIAISVVPMLFVGICGFIYARNVIETVLIADFNKIADLKTKRIKDFFNELEKDIVTTAGLSGIQDKALLLANSPADLSNPTYEKLRDELDNEFRLKHEVGRYLCVLIFNPQGVIIYEFHKSFHPSEGLGKKLAAPWNTTIEKGKKGVSFSDISMRISTDYKFSMLAAAPVHNEAGNIVGVIAFEINMAPIYDFIQETTGFGDTGETLVAKKEGNAALFLNPLRHDPDAALKRKAKFGKTDAIPIQKALHGESGSGRSVDYRGKDVIAAWRYIPSVDWGVVAKIDASEVFKPIAALLKMVFILTATFMLVGLFIAGSVSKAISDPIRSLQKGSEIIGRGNFDYKIGTTAKDEIGQLGRAFDQMTDNLKVITASRDSLDREIDERKQVETALQRSIDVANERVKELNCLFELSDLERQNRSLTEIFQGVVEIIPTAWQYPEITCAQIIMNGELFETINFRKTPWRLTSEIIVYEKIVGFLTVCTFEERPDKDHGPFIKEERKLIDAIAGRLGRLAEGIQAQQALADSENSFRSLVENAMTGISIVQDDQVVYQNKEQMRLLGSLPRERLFGELDKIHPDDREKVQKEIQKIGTGNNYRMDLEFRLIAPGETSKPSVIWIYCRALLIEYEGKKSILVNMMDMSKAKELEHLLIIQDKMASLGRVAAGIAHEIRNPLSGINIYLSTMEKIYDKAEHADKVSKIIGQVKSASMKIESVIKRVMDFSKPSTPRLINMDINRPINEAINLISVTLRKSGIKLDTSLAESLPLCNTDPIQFEEVILNLLNNSAEAMHEMERDKKITVTSTLAGGRILVTISDSGPGIPLEIREKIFEPFFTTRHEGTGIGLSICSRIIQDHGGRIGVYSNEWGGAEFIIEIPLPKKGE